MRLDRVTVEPLWKRLSPLMLAHGVNDFYSNVLPALLPLVKAKFDLSLALVGLASTTFTVSASLTQLLFGWLGDRFSRVNFAVWGPALTGAFMALAALAPSYGLLLPVLILAALGTAMFHPQATAIAGSLATHRRGLAISLFIAGGSLGFSLGPTLAASLFEGMQQAWGSWELGAWVLLGAVVLCWLMLQRTVPPPPQIRAGALPARALLAAWRPLFTLWLIVVLRHAVYLSFLTYLIILMQQRGFSYQEGSVILFFFLLGGALSTLVGGPLSDRHGRKPVVVVSLALVYPCLWLFLHDPGWAGYVGLIALGMALSINNPVIVAQAQELVPHHASTASAITMGLGWGVGSLLVSVAGLLADRWGIVSALDLIGTGTALAELLALGMKARS